MDGWAEEGWSGTVRLSSRMMRCSSSFVLHRFITCELTSFPALFSSQPTTRSTYSPSGSSGLSVVAVRAAVTQVRIRSRFDVQKRPPPGKKTFPQDPGSQPCSKWSRDS